MTDLTLAGILNEASSAYPSRARIEFNARAPKPSPACPKKCLRVTALSFCSRRGREGTIIIFRDWLSVANFRSKLTRRFWCLGFCGTVFLRRVLTTLISTVLRRSFTVSSVFHQGSVGRLQSRPALDRLRSDLQTPASLCCQRALLRESHTASLSG